MKKKNLYLFVLALSAPLDEVNPRQRLRRAVASKKKPVTKATQKTESSPSCNVHLKNFPQKNSNTTLECWKWNGPNGTCTEGKDKDDKKCKALKSGATAKGTEMGIILILVLTIFI